MEELNNLQAKSPEELINIVNLLAVKIQQRDTFIATLQEQLDIIPASIQIIEHVNFKYACKSCEETIKTGLTPNSLFQEALHPLVC